VAEGRDDLAAVGRDDALAATAALVSMPNELSSKVPK
jgi:hypothetical protein